MCYALVVLYQSKKAGVFYFLKRPPVRGVCATGSEMSLISQFPRTLLGL